MYISNVTDYDNMNDDYSNTFSLNNNCTDKEDNIDISVPTFLFTIPCGLSLFLCLLSLMVYTLIKPLFNKK